MARQYTGTGPLKSFVEKSNAIISAFENIEVRMPPGFSGKKPEILIEGNRLKLKMNDAVIYNKNHVVWVQLGTQTATFDRKVEVTGGKLKIKISDAL